MIRKLLYSICIVLVLVVGCDPDCICEGVNRGYKIDDDMRVAPCECPEKINPFISPMED